MNLPNTPAIARLSTILGVHVPSRIRDLVNPFLFDIPDPVLVTPTPAADPKEFATYQMTDDEPHVEIVTDADAVIKVLLPELSECSNGTKFSLKLTQGEGGISYAVLSGYGNEILIFTGIRYQFVVANGNNLSMLNDWVLWGTSIARMTGLIGEQGDTPADESLWGEIGTKEDEASTEGSVWAAIKNLQDRIGAIEEG